MMKVNRWNVQHRWMNGAECGIAELGEIGESVITGIEVVCGIDADRVGTKMETHYSVR